MLIPFAPIFTLCVLLQSLLLQSLDYHTASDAFHLGGYFLLGSNTAYILTGRITLLDGLLDVRYIEPPVTPYPQSPLLQASFAPHPMQISSHAWTSSASTSPPSHIVEVSATTVPTVTDASPALNHHLPLPELELTPDPEATGSLEVEPRSSAGNTFGDTTANVTSASILSSEAHSVIGDGLPPKSRSSLSLGSLVGRALDSQYAGLIALATAVMFGLLALGITLHTIRRPLAAQSCENSAGHTGCGHEEILRDVRRLLDHLGADKDVSLAEFCRSLQVADEAPTQEDPFRPASPSLVISSSFTALAQSPLAHKRAVRKRIPVFNMLPTPDPSGAGQQSAQSYPGPDVMPTNDSQLSDLFAFSPPKASSPVRTTSQVASKGKSMSWSSFRLPRSTAVDVIDRMNENRSLFFDNLFGRLDRLGEESPERSTRSNGMGNDSDNRSVAPQATHAERKRTLEDYGRPLQQKPSLARVTDKLQQWSWISAWVTCVVVLLMLAGVVPVAPAPPLVLS